MLRTVKVWVLYDPLSKVIMQMEQHKYQLPMPSKESGCVIFQLRGHYLSPVGKTRE